MEKPNPERNGGGLMMRLPVGFRFHPTDEELVVHYLKRKLHSLPLPASVIPEWDVYHSNPWDLPGDSRENRYFFNKRREDVIKKCSLSSSNITSSRRKRRVGALGGTSCGYWKAIGGYKQIVASGSGSGSKQVQVVGMKRSLAFCVYQGNRSRWSGWIMREHYCLVGSPTGTASSYSTQKQLFGNWVVCRIHQKRRRKANYHGITTGVNSSNIDTSTTSRSKMISKEAVISPSIRNLEMENLAGPPSHSPSPSPSSTPTSPCWSVSSGITQISSNPTRELILHQEEASTSTDFTSPCSPRGTRVH